MSPMPPTEEKVAGTVAETRPVEESSQRPRVLVVDDEVHIISALRRLFRREGYELMMAGSAEEALEILEEKPANLILSDHRMPGMSGTELLGEVRNRWPDTIRMILSGYSEVGTIITAINDGAVYKYLSKPWNDEEIKLHVRRALELQELQLENRRMAEEIEAQNEQLRDLNSMLKQRAEDASTGLTSVQDLLDGICVGVLTVDPEGLIIFANAWIRRLFAEEESELMGVSAGRALPASLFDPIESAIETGETVAGGLEYRGHRLRYRMNALEGDDDRRGSALVVWEEIR